MKYLISIKYDGSKFYGFQRLNDLDTVQKRIEEALSIINKIPVTIKGAGRTDRKVHALDQKASFNLNINIDEEHLKLAINRLVKPYIYITKVQLVDEGFHARFNVFQKEYIYKINMGEFNPLKQDYELQLNRMLDIEKMKKCAKLFTGIHNFKNFVAGIRKNYDCIIYDISFEEKENILEIKFIGKSFYRYMVRNLVGAMLDVEKGKNTLEDIKKALENPETKKQFSTALPEGLYLNKITYKKDEELSQ